MGFELQYGALYSNIVMIIRIVGGIQSRYIITIYLSTRLYGVYIAHF